MSVMISRRLRNERFMVWTISDKWRLPGMSLG